MTNLVLRMKTLPDLTNEKAWETVLEGAKEIERLERLVSCAGLSAFPEGKPPTDGRYLFWSPGNPHANNPSARWSYYRVDEICPDSPRGKYQFPEAPYTHFAPLPAAPSH